MSGTAALVEVLCGQEPVDRQNYLDALAGDGSSVYDRRPLLSFGRLIRVVAQEQHPALVRQSLENCAQDLKGTLEGVAKAHGAFGSSIQEMRATAQALEAATEADKPALRERLVAQREAHRHWGEALEAQRGEIEWLNRQEGDLSSRWEKLRDLTAHLDSLPAGEVGRFALPLWVRVVSTALGASAIGTALYLGEPLKRLPLYAGGIVVPALAFWPANADAKPVEAVHLPADGLRELFAALPAAESYGRFDDLCRQTGMFPPIGALAVLAEQTKSADWQPTVFPEGIGAWIDALNQSCRREEEGAPIRLLHRVLLDLSAQFGTRASDTCARLEWALKEGGCEIFAQPDPIHQEWVEELESGAVLREGRREGVLDAQVGSGVWRLEGGEVVVFDPLNEASLGIRRYEQKRRSERTGFTFAKVGRLIGGGRAARSEHLIGSAAGAGLVGEAGKTFRFSMEQEFKKVVEGGQHPAGDLAAVVQVTAQGQVRWVPTEEGLVDLDPLALERFFVSCALGDSEALGSWMERTGLSNCPAAIVQRSHLVSALRGGRQEGFDKRVREKVGVFNHLLDEAIDEVREKYEVTEEELSDVRAAMVALVDGHLRSNKAIIHPPVRLKEDLIHEVVLTEDLQEKR